MPKNIELCKKKKKAEILFDITNLNTSKVKII